MTLPAPNLDDRRFQDLVDEAKRFVQQRCPEWTDHNVSDPGVTLIETFALLVDHLVYRLNRVPDRLYVKFLELIGIRLFPPTAARAEVTFWLSAPLPEPVLVPRGTQVATMRSDAVEAIPFSVLRDLTIVPCSLARVATLRGGRSRDVTDVLAGEEEFPCFSDEPQPGDALMVGLSVPAPSCAILLRIHCDIEGVGVDPRDPPLAWEAWDGDSWEPCEVGLDETGGLNRPGDIVLHTPRVHASSSAAGQQAAWIRCRVTAPKFAQPMYRLSPQIRRMDVWTIGGTTEVVQADLIEGEILGVSEGVPGQRFSVQHAPVVASSEPLVLEVSAPDGWEEWSRVESFAASTQDDNHFIVDSSSGEIELGPCVREPDGTLRYFGATAPRGTTLRLRSYQSGGGRRGNVATGAINLLKSSIPYITRVENRRPATGGVDAEDIESAKLRGPLLLRSRDRAVTAEDYEQLALVAAPEVARADCLPAGDGSDSGSVRILIVPEAEDDDAGQVTVQSLLPSDETLERVARHLDQHRLVGTRLFVEPPIYHGLTVVAKLRSYPGASAKQVADAARRELNRYYHPLRGGPSGTGWPAGRAVHAGEVYGVLQSLAGVELVEDVILFPANPVTGVRGEPHERLDLPRNALVLSYNHQITVDSV